MAPLFSRLAHIIILGTLGTPAFASDTKPWLFAEQMGLPETFSFKGEFRSRYETLDEQFRRGSSGSDQILSLRTLAELQVHLHQSLKVKLELQDARAKLVDQGSAMSSSIVNSAELLEANMVWTAKNLFTPGSVSELRGGRFTLDLGKRRFIARNRFRNVIQAYTGIDWKWTAKNGIWIRTLITLPVNREPSARTDLLENDPSFDEEKFETVLWGPYLHLPNLPANHKGDFFFFGFHEEDDDDFQTRNREFYMPGFRLWKPPQINAFDYELESMFQFGTVRATNSPADKNDLEHFAFFHHFQFGYSFDAPGNPHLYFEYDYASGDADPNDGNSGRFERLFGPNVSEFGPTSIYTAFVRANINSPGLRLKIHPSENLSAYFSYRAFWLAEARDAWQGSSRLRDVSGNSGTFLGQQFLIRGSWKLHPNIKLGFGIAYRVDGEFQDEVPNGPRNGNTLFSYLGTTLYF